MPTENSILLAYFVTVASETIVILSIQKPDKIWRWVLGIALANSLTHPVAIYFLHVQNMAYIFVELGVLIVESIWYKFAFQIRWKRSLEISTIANISSIIAGITIRFLLG